MDTQIELTSTDEQPIPFAWLGDLLISLRKERGLTQAQLAERLGIHQVVIARWESSKYATASLERIRKVVDALDADLRLTVGQEESKKS